MTAPATEQLTRTAPGCARCRHGWTGTCDPQACTVDPHRDGPCQDEHLIACPSCRPGLARQFSRRAQRAWEREQAALAMDRRT